MIGGSRPMDVHYYARRMHALSAHAMHEQARPPKDDASKVSVLSWRGFPFASISVLVVLLTLFMMSMERGGWTWSSWTYAPDFLLVVLHMLDPEPNRATGHQRKEEVLGCHHHDVGDIILLRVHGVLH